MIDDLTNNDGFKVAAATVTGGGFIGWFRERRRGRKDANTFALEFLDRQALRIDKLVEQVAALEAERTVDKSAIEALRVENHRLRGELAMKELELYELKKGQP